MLLLFSIFIFRIIYISLHRDKIKEGHKKIKHFCNFLDLHYIIINFCPSYYDIVSMNNYDIL